MSTVLHVLRVLQVLQVQIAVLVVLLNLNAIENVNVNVVVVVDGAPQTIDHGKLSLGAQGSTQAGGAQQGERQARLGAGYSVSTNSFYTSCLDVNEKNIVSLPSYTHECK